MTANSIHQSVREHGIGIQNIGDGNPVIVYAGRAELSLLRKHARKAQPKTELQLLRVDLRATTLVGRDAELTALKAWLTSDRLVIVRCLTGRAGAGVHVDGPRPPLRYCHCLKTLEQRYDGPGLRREDDRIFCRPRPIRFWKSEETSAANAGSRSAPKMKTPSGDRHPTVSGRGRNLD
jgi:hypothetical protein